MLETGGQAPEPNLRQKIQEMKVMRSMGEETPPPHPRLARAREQMRKVMNPEMQDIVA